MAKSSILPLLAIVAFVGEPASTMTNPPEPEGSASSQAGGTNSRSHSAEEILNAAIHTLESQTSVSAKISQEINLFGKELIGTGVYLEQQLGPLRLMRLHLKIQLGDERSFLLQVCDGRFLWTRKKLFDKEELTRIDIARAAKALEKAKQVPPQGSVGILHNLGGLCKLLRKLQTTFDFNSVQPGVLKVRSTERPIWQLRGNWKPHYLVRLLAKQKETVESGKAPDPSDLPEHLPDHVLLVLGQEDLFPYRIEYRRTGKSKPLVGIHLDDVTTDVPIDPNRFQYNPGKTKFDDVTERFLRTLGVERK